MSWSSVCIFFENLIKISNIIKTCSIAAFCYAFFLRKQYASFVYSVSINKLYKGERCGFFEKITKWREALTDDVSFSQLQNDALEELQKKMDDKSSIFRVY